MKRLALCCFVLGVFAAPAYSEECPASLQFSLKPLRGSETVDFCQAYRGKVILAVNTASRCGYTPQFKGLEALYQKYKDRGFVVLGFPSDDFKQEYAEAEKTAEVCYLNYGVTFPVFTKSSVKGESANTFFKGLAQATGTQPKWNFFKYLIDRQGKIQKAYPSQVEPEDADLQKEIETLIAQ